MALCWCVRYAKSVILERESLARCRTAGPRRSNAGQQYAVRGIVLPTGFSTSERAQEGVTYLHGRLPDVQILSAVMPCEEIRREGIHQ